MLINIIMLYMLFEFWNIIAYYISKIKIHINKKNNNNKNNQNNQNNQNNNNNNKFVAADKLVNKFVASDELVNNVLEHDMDPHGFIEQLFYNKYKYEEINKPSIRRAFAYLLFAEREPDELENEYIDKYINLFEQKYGNKFLDGGEIQECIEIGHAKIYTWYMPLFYRIIKYFTRIGYELFMHYHGFRKIKSDKLVLWIRTDNEIKYRPLILFHCSVGIIGYPKVLPLLSSNRTIIIPEISGILWNSYSVSDPDKLCTILFNELDKLNIHNYDILMHSYGFVLGLKYLHKYHEHIHKIIVAESPVIMNHSLKPFVEFVDVMKYINFTDVIDVIAASTTCRDIVIQYHLQRCATPHNTTLIGFLHNDAIESTKDIYFILSGDDNRVPVKHYQYHIDKKNLPYKTIVLDNRKHGAFLYDTEFQKHVIDIINQDI